MWGHSISPYLGGTELSSISISCSTKLQQTLSALCFEKTSAFRFSTALSESSSLSDILPFRCSISGRTCLFAANSASVGLTGKFEQLDNPSSVSEFLENNFLEDFNSFILFSIHTWFACKGHLVTSNFSEAMRSQVSFPCVLSLWLLLCSTTHSHTVQSE